MSSESKIRTPSDGIVGALAAHARGFIDSLLGIGRKNRLKISRMIYPDYDAISDLMNKNESILGIEKFSLNEGTGASTGNFTGVVLSKIKTEEKEEDIDSMFEPVTDSGMQSEIDYSAAPVVNSNCDMATPTSATVESPAGSGSMIGIVEEPQPREAEKDAHEFFPDIEQTAEAEPEVISFPIEDEVVDMMILTVGGIDYDAVEFSDAEQENVALSCTAVCEADEGCMFCACDGTVIDMTVAAEEPADEAVCMLAAPAETAALAAPAPMEVLSAPVQAAAIAAPAEVLAVEAPEQLPEIEASSAADEEEAEMQAALIAAGVEVFVQETVDRLVAEDEAESQAKLEAAIRDAALAADAVRDMVQRTVDRIAAEEAEKQAKLEAAIEQAALTAAAVQVFVQESIDRIAAEEAEKQAKLEAAIREAALVAEAVRSMVRKTVDSIADAEAAYVPEVHVEAPAAEVYAQEEPETYAEVFAVPAESEDFSADVCAEAVTQIPAAQAAEAVTGRTSVSFGFFGMPVSPMSRASTVNFRFGRA